MDEQFDMYSQRRERPSDDGWPRERLTLATLDEIGYSEQLRLQTRAAYQRKAAPPLAYWSLNVE